MCQSFIPKMTSVFLPVFVAIALTQINPIKAAEETTITQENITYALYSRNHNGTLLTLNNLHILNPLLSTVFLLHGHGDTGNTAYFGAAVNAYRERGDTNVITIDWSDVAALDYLESLTLIDDVGLLIAQLIENAYNNHGVSLETMTIVGHSLGAQISGYIGRSVQDLTGLQVDRLIGLDAAGPFFWDFVDETEHIGAGDGGLVLCIHTNVGVLGTAKAICDVDYFPHGGFTQPGCETTDLDCNHARCTDLYVESIQNPAGFVGVKCSSWLVYVIGACDANDKVTLGGRLTKANSGKYYLRTNSQYPFSLN